MDDKETIFLKAKATEESFLSKEGVMEEQSGKRGKSVSGIISKITPSSTSKKQIKRALAVSEEKYRSAFEYTGTGMMILDEDMTIFLVNQQVCGMTGYTHEEVEGKRLWPELVAEHDRERMMYYHRERRKNPAVIPTEYEFQYKHKSGSLHDALVTISMIPGTKQSLVSMIDITDRKATEKDLIESRRRFKETAELLPTIICEINTDMRFVYVNKIGLAMFGYSQEEFEKGIDLAQLIHKDDLERARSNIAHILQGETLIPQEYRLVHKNGTVRDYLVTSSRITKDGEVVGIRSSILDISERKQMERQLRESEERLRSIYSASPIGIALFNEEGGILDFNRSFQKMFGLPDDVAYDSIAFSLFKDVIKLKDGKEKVIKKGGMTFESESDFKFARGNEGYEVVPMSRRCLNWCITKLGGDSGSAPQFLAQVQDTTERKRAEEKKLSQVQRRADEAHRIVEGLRKEVYRNARFHNMVSRSPAMQEIFNVLPEIAQTVTTVLITGESGTGKELVASSIHALSPRKDRPFVAINCGALPDNLLESELFGYKAGAFTDAKKDKPGKFALAEGGTIFLDEIGDISAAMQVKLLRVIQEKVFEPLGATQPVKADVRIIAATNRHLPDMVKNGAFREDLYYRIKVLNLALPPLRERKSDIPLLCDHFISLFNVRFKKNITDLSHEALDILLAHDYPGNIRELENILEHAFIFCKEEIIEPAHLPREIVSAQKSAGKQNGMFEGVTRFEELEKVFIEHILSETGGSRIKAAQRLGIHKATLFRKMKRLGITEV